MLGSKKISPGQFKKIKIFFIVFSCLVVFSIIALIVLQSYGKIKCNESHGIGNLILSLLEAPLYIITFIFVAKIKQHIKIVTYIRTNLHLLLAFMLQRLLIKDMHIFKRCKNIKISVLIEDKQTTILSDISIGSLVEFRVLQQTMVMVIKIEINISIIEV